MEEEKFHFNHALICFHPENPDEILHICGYEEEPDELQINYLREELRVDEEFGLTEIADSLIIEVAEPEEVQKFRELFSADNPDII